VTTSDDDFAALPPKLMALYPDAPSMKCATNTGKSGT
jgi:hypothetical protein